MATRQFVIDFGRGTARAGYNVLSGDPGETTLDGVVDVADAAISYPQVSYTSVPASGLQFDSSATPHTNAAGAISWLDVASAEAKHAADAGNTLSLTISGIGSTASFSFVTQTGFSAARTGEITVNSETSGQVNLNFNSTNPGDANYYGNTTDFVDVAADGSGNFVLSLLDPTSASPFWNAVLVTFDDTGLGAVNNPASGLPSITGTAQTGQTVTADTSSISDADGLGSFTYQWNRNGSPISGETGSTYVLAVADESQSITVDVSFTDGEGNAEGPLTSPAITPSAPAANNAPVGVDDTATTDEDTSVNIDVLANDTDADSDTLSVTAASATNGTVVIETDNTLTYTPNSGFTGSDTISYTVSDGTDTDTASVTVTVNEVVSGLTPPIGSPSAQSQLIDEITVAGPLFNGIAAANPGLDLVGLGAFAEVITGTPTYDLATGSWETLASNTEWDVYVYNGAWSSASRVSASAGQASTDVGGGTVNTPATGQPTITGTAQVGSTLTADTSGIADADGLGTLNIQWLLDGSPINGATNTTYVPVAGDADSDVSVQVSFTDGEGNAEGPLTSSAVTIQAAPVSNTPTTGSPVITGTAQVGQQLGVDASALADVDGLGTFTYSWRLDGSEVGTAATYTPNATGSLLVRVSHTDGGGTVETVSSAAVTVQPTPAGITEDSGNPIPASITVPAGGSYDLKQHFVIPNGSTAVFTVISGLLGQGVSMTSLGVLSNTGAAATTNSVTFNVEAA